PESSLRGRNFLSAGRGAEGVDWQRYPGSMDLGYRGADCPAGFCPPQAVRRHDARPGLDSNHAAALQFPNLHAEGPEPTSLPGGGRMLFDPGAGRHDPARAGRKAAAHRAVRAAHRSPSYFVSVGCQIPPIPRTVGADRGVTPIYAARAEAAGRDSLFPIFFWRSPEGCNDAARGARSEPNSGHG